MKRTRTTPVAMLFAALAIAATAPRAHALYGPFLFVITTDYSTGSATEIEEAKLASIDVASVHSDATARFFDEQIFVVNRGGADNIQVLDPFDNYSTTIQFSVGNGSNPHDVSVVDATTCYVTRYDTDEMWVMNHTTGAHTGTIDFSSLADGDGRPEMDQMYRHGSHLFVSVQRLDINNFYTPVGDSYLAVIDVGTNAFVDTDTMTAGTQHILLPATNPFSEIQYDGTTGTLYFSCVGNFGVADGGVVRVDPDTFQPQGYMITESAAGGDVLDVEIVRSDTAFAIVNTPLFYTHLINFNPQTGVKYGTVYGPSDYVLNDIDLSPWDDLMLSDRTTTNPGIRCYDPSTGAETTTSPIGTGLPPADLTFGGPIVTGAQTPRTKTALGPNYPNPFNPTTTIPYSLETAGPIDLAIYDVTGRRIRTLYKGNQSAGDHETQWNGVGDRGANVGSGVYFVRLESKNNTEVRKIVMLK